MCQTKLWLDIAANLFAVWAFNRFGVGVLVTYHMQLSCKFLAIHSSTNYKWLKFETKKIYALVWLSPTFAFWRKVAGIKTIPNVHVP